MATSPDPAVPPQIIPRPASARPGGSAPWADLSPEDRRGLTLDRVLAALARADQIGAPPPPGAPATTVRVLDTSAPVAGEASSAVLVPLFEADGEARVLLTRRSSRLRAHRGEVSFPGGRREPGEDPTTAALRETFEEVGIEPAAVTVRGWLHPLVTVSSGSLIRPVVGTLAGPPVVVANPDEVDRVFDVALSDLAADGVFAEESWRLPGSAGAVVGPGRHPVWFFTVAGEIVWGATARMLVELLTLALGLELPR